MANTTFNGPVRAENGFEQITVTAKTGAVTTNFDIDSSGNISGTGTSKMTGATNLVLPYESLTAATKAATAAESGTTFVFNRAAGVVVTLPVAAVGVTYKFIVGTTVTSNALTIKGATAVDCFTAYSMVTLFDKDNNVAQSKIFLADGSDDDVFSMNGGTTGGFLGSVITVTGIAAGGQGSATAVWHLNSDRLIADGTLATPFA
tara:strand:- start:1179 stop:1790 length:612 start_codon:yes stop_codon:yes gene_type:complete